MPRFERKSLIKKLYKITPSKKVVAVEGFETEREAAEAANGVRCWIITGWPKKAIHPATRITDHRGQVTYYYKREDGENHFSRWSSTDFPTFKEAKAHLLAELNDDIERERESLARQLKQRNEVRSMRAPKKSKGS